MFANLTDEDGFRPSFEAHSSYITGVTVNRCGYVVQLLEHQRCAFVEQTPDCHELETYFSYINWVFCNGVGSTLDWVVLLFWFVLLLLVLMVNVELVLVPSLMYIANALNLGEFLTGVTLVAVSNGIADLVSSSQKYGGDTEMAVNQMFGTALFVTLGIGGIITVVWPFSEIKAFFLWTRAIYLTAVLVVFGILFNEVVTIWEALVGFVLYAIFIAFVVFEHYRNYKKLKAMGEVDEKLSTPRRKEAIAQLKRIVGMPKMRGVRFPPAPSDHGPNAFMGGYYRLYMRINPGVSFYELSVISKIGYVITCPIKYVFLLTIPTTMYMRPVRGWCKLAIMINVFFVPPLWMIAFNLRNWLFYAGGFGLSVILSIVVMFTSRTDRPPKYHVVVAVVAFCTAILVEYFAASESVSVASILFKIIRVDRATMGITVLTWSNSFGDLVANLYIARIGFHRLAHAACFGGPIFNILLGVALKFTFRSISGKDTVVKIRSGAMAPVSISFLVAGLLISGLAVMWSNFQNRCSIGIWMIVTYVLYLVFTTLVELEYIHAYGTDHYDEQPFEI